MSANTAYIFHIGRELLEGLVLDRNANFMAGKLNDAGCQVRGIQVLGDDEEALVKALKATLADKPAYILTTGGMGPGHDDITRQCVARAAELPLQRDPSPPPKQELFDLALLRRWRWVTHGRVR